MQFEIRPAQSLDAGGVGAVMGQANDAFDWLPRVHSRAQEVGFASQMINAGWVEVVRQGGMVKGFLAREGAEIPGLYLHPDLQGRGIARLLIDRAKRAQPHLGLWVFQANARAQHIYRRAGFHEVARTQGHGNDAGLPDIRFEWTKGNA